jgi:GNAT superfamily N-acetyltransferase
MIQKATQQMADEILQVINISNQACYQSIIPDPYFTCPYLSMQELLVQFDSMAFYVALDADEITGVAALQTQSQRTGQVSHVYVLPVHHRKGIGTALMHHVHQEAARHGLTRLRLRVGEKAVWATNFYCTLGYTCCERCDCPEGWVLVMEKALLTTSPENGTRHAWEQG